MENSTSIKWTAPAECKYSDSNFRMVRKQFRNKELSPQFGKTGRKPCKQEPQPNDTHDKEDLRRQLPTRVKLVPTKFEPKFCRPALWFASFQTNWEKNLVILSEAWSCLLFEQVRWCRVDALLYSNSSLRQVRLYNAN